MTLEDRLDILGRAWRGPLLAAAVALIGALPGLLALPPLDRDESRFAEASAQMLETGDFVTVRFQETPRFKKPVGVYWLQAAAVAALSQVEAREIWAYRIPSLLGVMIAAAACAWGAAAFLRPGPSLMAGAMLGAAFLASTEGAIAATDGVLAGAVTLAMAALARLYLADQGGPPAGRGVKAAFWTALALSILVKGPIGPMVVALTLIALALWDRRITWLKTLNWGWGLILIVAVVGPWAMAISVATDGAFWGAAVGGDLAPKLVGADEGHGAPPGFYLALLPLLMFPACLLLPAGVLAGWRTRAEPATRFALCWLVPAWLVFELTPTKLVHYTLPLFGALAWLMARALAEPPGRGVRVAGAALILLAAGAFAAAGPVAMARLGDGSGLIWSIAAGVLFLAAGAVGAVLLLRRRARRALAWAGVVALGAHGVLAAGVAPALRPLWLSQRTADALARARFDPRDGLTPGPVTVAGYEEPSLVFLLGTTTELGDVDDAADAVGEGRPAVVEARQEAAFRAALAEQRLAAGVVGQVSGLDYSNNRRDMLRIWRALPRAPAKATP